MNASPIYLDCPADGENPTFTYFGKKVYVYDPRTIIGWGKKLHNRGTINFSGVGQLNVLSIDNQDGTIEQSGSREKSSVITRELDNRVSGPLTLSKLKVDNEAGQISSDNLLIIDGKDVSNAGGTLHAGEFLIIKGGLPSGPGQQLLSDGTLLLEVDGNCANSSGSTIRAARQVDLVVKGKFTNHGAVESGAGLIIKAKAITNQCNATINGQQTKLLANRDMDGVVKNFGLIDGQTTEIRSDIVSNLNGGQLYGDYLSIGAVEVTNQAGAAASKIAARQKLAIGTQQLANSAVATISSRGSLSIGGRLNELGEVVGQATELTNEGQINFVTEGKLDAKSINNQKGTIEQSGTDEQLGESHAAPRLTCDKLNNHRGTIRVSGPLTLSNMGVDNRSGTLSSATTLTVDSKNIVIDGVGTLHAGKVLTIKGSLPYGAGEFLSDGTLMLEADGACDNHAGSTIHAAGQADLVVKGRFTNRGSLESKAALTIKAEAITNLHGASINSQQTKLLADEGVVEACVLTVTCS